MKHILMVCYGGGHMKVLAPLYAELSLRYRVTVLALTSAGSYMREQGIPSLGFRDFAFTRSSDIQAYGQQLAVDVPENGVVPREETVAYLGSSFFDLVNQLKDEGEAYELYRKKGRAAFLPVASLRKIIDELHVDAVITTNAPRAERAALIVAKELCLPSVCVNDNLWIRGGVSDVADFGLADRICVLNDFVKGELLSKTCVDVDVVKVTGSPVFDPLKLARWIPNDLGVPRVLLADCELPEKHPYLDLRNAVQGIECAIRDELNRLASEGVVDVYFRPHPSQEYDYSAYPFCKLSDPKESLIDRLSRTDVVVTAISTVGVEGKAMGLGLVSIEKTVFSTLESYEKIGMSTGVVHPEQLRGAIFKEFEKDRELDFLYKGRALKNVISVVERVVL
ncbi:hypothetical protein [Halomonas sp. NCCP-2165]|nr:hypothetical protein [Halomonas sp. NCCP-2165]GKW49734.1 hypothetical protein NCCP2165_19490 [Halomonas sp. NCCP-2165]